MAELDKQREELQRRQRSVRARQKVEDRARKLLPKVLEVYKRGMDSEDERIRKSCADAIRDIAIGRPARQAARDDNEEQTSLIFSEPPELNIQEGDGRHQSLDLE